MNRMDQVDVHGREINSHLHARRMMSTLCRTVLHLRHVQSEPGQAICLADGIGAAFTWK